MTATLALILLVVAAYLAAHLLFEWLGRRFLIVSGAEYLVLGILLGPNVSGAIGATTVDRFAAFMTLALGWVGALVGAQFYVPDLIRIRATVYRVAFTEALLSLTVIAGVMAFVLAWTLGEDVAAMAAPATVLGAIGATSSASGVALVAMRMRRRDVVVQQLQVTTGIDALVGITAFSVLLSLVHPAPAVLPRAPTSAEWVDISLGIGLVGGALFHLFLAGERSIDRLFIGLAGAVILASGASAYLQLSPLLPTFLIGAVLVNTSRNRDDLRAALAKVERPLYYALLIFAGAAWQPSTREWLWVLAVVAFVLGRLVVKLGSARIAARTAGVEPVLGREWGLGLLGQGGVAAAIGLNYRIDSNSMLAHIVFTATIVSILLTDFGSARLASAVVRSYRERLERWAGHQRTPQGPAPRGGAP